MNIEDEKDHYFGCDHELEDSVEDSFMGFLHKIIRGSVRVLAALIAIEIFINITLYLKTNVIQVRLATDLMAISRKATISTLLRLRQCILWIPDLWS